MRSSDAARRPLTLATATTVADRSRSADVAPNFNVLLRALHRPHPATVSDWIAVKMAPSITLEVTSAAPLHVSGTIGPTKREVTVAPHRGARATGAPRGRAAGRQRRPVPRAIHTPRPGTYTLIASTAADADNTAGASAPVRVKIT